jgi:hypothetical protein
LLNSGIDRELFGVDRRDHLGYGVMQEVVDGRRLRRIGDEGLHLFEKVVAHVAASVRQRNESDGATRSHGQTASVLAWRDGSDLGG